MKKKIIFTLGDRGGTGKTTVAKLVWEPLRRLNALAFDLDGTTGAFSQIYSSYDATNMPITPQPRDGVTPLLLHAEDREGRDEAISALISAEADVVLVDMPATSLTVLERIQKDWSMFEVLNNAGIEVVTVNVVTPFKSSLQNVVRTLTLAPNAKPVVVLNLFAGKRDLFFLWDGDSTHKESNGKAQLRERGGIEIELPPLEKKQSILIDADDMSFGEACVSMTEAMDRMYVYNWMRAVEMAFAPASETFGFPAPVLK
ncbi:MAG: P-loop NTPase family protein [Vulcanimicrobiaceae bacterium]